MIEGVVRSTMVGLCHRGINKRFGGCSGKRSMWQRHSVKILRFR